MDNIQNNVGHIIYNVYDIVDGAVHINMLYSICNNVRINVRFNVSINIKDNVMVNLCKEINGE